MTAKCLWIAYMPIWGGNAGSLHNDNDDDEADTPTHTSNDISANIINMLSWEVAI